MGDYVIFRIIYCDEKEIYNKIIVQIHNSLYFSLTFIIILKTMPSFYKETLAQLTLQM